MKRTIFNYLLLTLLFSFYAFSSTNNIPPIEVNTANLSKESKDNEIPLNGYQIKTIVLDAGHGGKDAGCSGSHSKEKHIALNVVLKLGRAIEQQFPYINVIYTRKTDVFIPLYQRAAIANKNEADLFISIHCNAISKKASHVHGSETYVMGLHTAEHNLDVARRENEAILLEDDYQQNYQGFDPNSDEGHIFLSMFQNAFLDKSIQFAEKVETKIKVKAKRKSRGVKQAGFVVLKETTMPSVLIETGYLTNQQDESFLLTDNGQNKIANAVFEAFLEYKSEVEEYTPAPVIATTNPRKPISSQPPTTHNTSLSTQPSAKIIQKKSTSTPKAVPTSLVIKEEKKITNNPVPTTKPSSILLSNAEASAPKSTIVFKIQLAASPAEIETSNQKWSKIPFVEVRKEKNLYKYLTGSHANYELAVKDRNEVLKKGFNGAFIVAYKDGERVSLKVARAAPKEN